MKYELSALKSLDNKYLNYVLSNKHTYTAAEITAMPAGSFDYKHVNTNMPEDAFEHENHTEYDRVYPSILGTLA